MNTEITNQQRATGVEGLRAHLGVIAPALTSMAEAMIYHAVPNKCVVSALRLATATSIVEDYAPNPTPEQDVELRNELEHSVRHALINAFVDWVHRGQE